ncbi:MAG: hypothetical protein R2707_14630 [Acidimicrobiales bacterium]
MDAFPVQPTSHTSIRVVLIAGAGPVGLTGAIALLDQLPELRCPVVVSVRGASIDHLQTHIDGVRSRWATHGALLDDAALWISPPNRHTYIRDGRFELSGDESTAPATMPSLGKLYHSLRVEFGSRVFAVVIDETEPNSPTLRLLAQRGARVVSPLECGPGDIAHHRSSQEIVTYLSEHLAATPRDAAAIA